jgi:hypothetical protein
VATITGSGFTESFCSPAIAVVLSSGSSTVAVIATIDNLTDTSFTVTIPAEPAGTYNVTVQGGNGAYSGSLAYTYTNTPDSSVIDAHPVLVSILPGGIDVNLELSATLTDTTTQTHAAGETIAFTVGHNAVCTAQTDAHGTATCTGPCLLLVAIFAGGYTATFNGSPTLAPASDTASLLGL